MTGNKGHTIVETGESQWNEGLLSAMRNKIEEWGGRSTRHSVRGAYGDGGNEHQKLFLPHFWCNGFDSVRPLLTFILAYCVQFYR